jgi:hypothetical protein
MRLERRRVKLAPRGASTAGGVRESLPEGRSDLDRPARNDRLSIADQ